MSIKFDILRMYPRITVLLKHTYTTSQRLEVGDRALPIPANTYI